MNQKKKEEGSTWSQVIKITREDLRDFKERILDNLRSVNDKISELDRRQTRIESQAGWNKIVAMLIALLTMIFLFSKFLE